MPTCKGSYQMHIWQLFKEFGFFASSRNKGMFEKSALILERLLLRLIVLKYMPFLYYYNKETFLGRKVANLSQC